MKKEEWLSHKADQIVSETDPTSIVPTVEMRLYKQVSRIAVKKKKKTVLSMKFTQTQSEWRQTSSQYP